MAGFFLSTFTHKKNTIENIVFEGAGIRGIAYAGALETLEQKGLLKNATRIGSTSAGAVTACNVRDEKPQVNSLTNFLNNMNHSKRPLIKGTSNKGLMIP